MSGREQSEAHMTSLGTFTALKSNMLDLAVGSFFLNLLGLALPLSLLQVYDRIVPNTSYSTLSLLLLGITGALVLEGILRTCRSYITGWIGARFDYLAGTAAVERLLSASVEDFERDGSGMHMERMASLGTVKEFYAGQAVLALLDLPFVVIYLGLIGFMGGTLVLIPIVLLVIFALSAIILGLKLRGALGDRMVADERRFNFIIEVLNGIHTVKSMAMESQMLRRYERLQEGCAQGDYTVAQSSASAMSLSSFFSQLTMVCVVGAGSTLVIAQEMTVGGLAACTMLSARSMNPLMRAMGIWSRFQTIRLARERLHQIFALKPEAPPGLPTLPTIKGDLVMKNVSFRYDKDGPNVIENVNLEMKAGDCIGIAGGNGSGKSTLLGLMLGILKPSEGTVMLDGHDISDYEPRALRKHMAYLPQKGELFKGTILENITMFDSTLDDDAVLVANALGLDDVVSAMPLGYDTVVAEGTGDSLPRGIKQRLAIARALIYGPQVVLFDEANSAIDGAGDNYLREALEKLKGGCTMVLVTHRPSHLKLAERVFSLDEGKLSVRKAQPWEKKKIEPKQPSSAPVIQKTKSASRKPAAPAKAASKAPPAAPTKTAAKAAAVTEKPKVSKERKSRRRSSRDKKS